MADIQKPLKLVQTMLHECHAAQRSLSEMKASVMAKHLNQRQRAMDCLSRAQSELEGAELALLRLDESLADGAKN